MDAFIVKEENFDLTNKGYTPEQVYGKLEELGYCHGDPDFYPYGSVIMEFTKPGKKVVKVHSNAISFKLTVTFHEPPNYFLDWR